MSKLDFQTLRVLSEKGVAFFIDVPVEGGQKTIQVAPEDLMIFADDPEATYAKTQGVTKSEYRDWMDDECMAYCAAKTKAGRPCPNLVPGGFQVSAKQWVKLQGGYCGVHGERDKDLSHPKAVAGIESIFDRGSSGGSNIARQKHSMIEEAFHFEASDSRRGES
jgi:hypothetical protein